ncbi:MAG: protein translocase subunit SecD [Planctomycetota bacterium]|nr:protein translocase subunit SecD [Planctomycetota bacterium]
MEQKSPVAPRALLILVITALLVWAYQASGIRLGQDLKGGTTLRFTLDIDGAKAAGLIDSQLANSEVVDQTLRIIGERIDKYGLAEIQLAQYGDNQFIVSLPADSGTRPEAVVKVISQLGDLKFRIEVLPDSKLKSYSEGGGGHPKAARLGLWKGTDEAFYDFKEKEVGLWRRARDRGEDYKPSLPQYLLVKRAKIHNSDGGYERPDGSSLEHFAIVESTSGEVDFDGGILTNPIVGEDPNTRRPVVLYEVKNDFQNDFGRWTAANIGLPMAIILNNEYHSAPIINDQLTKNVQISLGQGSRSAALEEANALATVLQTGSLKIQPVLEAKDVMGPSLAGQSRERGIQAVIAAFLLVLVFMVFYYRTSGMVANVALLLNIVLLVGFMAFFQAVLTLPGIAGIVLTVGMAVDANILISERIREERNVGRSMARAVAEGYGRALSAIVDANVTSLITAVFLYNFGSGPVRGFAVTLAIGLVVSMFTAIFVTRTIVDWMLHAGMMKEFKAFGSGIAPNIRWLSMRRIFGPISVVGMVLGLGIFAMTDKYTLYDIDFTGGYRIQAEFLTRTSPDEVGQLLATTKHDVEVEVSRFDEVTGDRVKEKKVVSVGPYPDAQVLSTGETGRGVEISVQRLFFGSSKEEEEQALAFRSYMRRVLGDRLMPDWQIQPISRYNHVAPEGVDAAQDPLAEYAGGIHGVIALSDPAGLLSADLLKKVLRDDLPFWVEEDGADRAFSPSAKGLTRRVEVRPFSTASEGVAAFEIWMKSSTAGGVAREQDADVMADRIAEYLGGRGLKERVAQDLPEDQKGRTDSLALSQPFSSEAEIGSTVAERLRDDAMIALFLSLVFIILYIAFRFRSRAMGFAAVLCVFHDVAITLGLVAIANRLGLVDAKINLSMVAALLTLVGFSVNDTVVIFDRIRENRGKRPTIDEDLLDLSINQTLARTIRTTATFLLVCVALFAFNYGQRNVLEGFSFLLILGSIIGTYSTVAISTPLLLFLPWVWKRLSAFTPKGSLVTGCMGNVGLMLALPIAALAWLAWGIVFAVGAFVAGLVLFVPWCLGGGATKAAVTA